jgi:hypothetical protein
VINPLLVRWLLKKSDSMSDAQERQTASFEETEEEPRHVNPSIVLGSGHAGFRSAPEEYEDGHEVSRREPDEDESRHGLPRKLGDGMDRSCEGVLVACVPSAFEHLKAKH